MLKMSIIALTAGLSLGTTAARAEGDIEAVIRMVILGTQSGENDGVFSTEAVSVSAGFGPSVLGGFVADSDTGALGTAVSVGEGDLSGSLTGFETSSPFETDVCSPLDACTGE